MYCSEQEKKVDRMLYVFHVDTGTMLKLDMRHATGRSVTDLLAVGWGATH